MARARRQDPSLQALLSCSEDRRQVGHDQMRETRQEDRPEEGAALKTTREAMEAIAELIISDPSVQRNDGLLYAKHADEIAEATGWSVDGIHRLTADLLHPNTQRIRWQLGYKYDYTERPPILSKIEEPAEDDNED